MHYDKHISKNYKVSLDCYQEEHFGAIVFVHDVDVIETFNVLFRHLPKKSTFQFHQPIDNPWTIFWYLSLHVSMKSLAKILKDIQYTKVRLSYDSITNKSR